MEGAIVMVNSVDVKSLLMRLHDEIQSGQGNTTANRASFAQSLSASLGEGRVPSVKKDEVAALVVLKGEGVLPVSSKGEHTAGGTSKEELEMSKLTDRRGVQAQPPIKNIKDEDVATVIGVNASAEKTAVKPTTLSNEVKRRTEKSRGHKDHDGSSADTTVSAIVPGEAKAIAADSPAQVVDGRLMVVASQSADQPVQMVTADGEEAGGLSSGNPQGVKSSVNGMTRGSVAQKAKPSVRAPDGHTGKGAAMNTNSANDDREMTVPDGTVHARASTASEGAVATPAKIASADETIRKTADSMVAPITISSHPTSSNHIGDHIKESRPLDAMQTMVEPGGRATELHQVSVQDHQMLTATASSIEVGIASGTHGWLKIRAEMTDTGTIKAALSSTSQTGQAMLHRELPSLSSFLEQERVAVSSVVVHQTALSPGLDAGTNGGSGAMGHESSGEKGNSGNRDQSQSFSGMTGVELSDGLFDARQGDQIGLASLAGGGGWLSVRA